ncbi:hypothetical protein CDAR_287071 [Caerostris darwini]|uniref:Uncharacterized protein n=1 Tax=Caerostris darwini TaxID=1538125 RepID=A0AAV4RGX1_9ARAC|nr:hypothetical protein CDAR_287071 [Caerostris darwini]
MTLPRVSSRALSYVTSSSSQTLNYPDTPPCHRQEALGSSSFAPLHSQNSSSKLFIPHQDLFILKISHQNSLLSKFLIKNHLFIIKNSSYSKFNNKSISFLINNSSYSKFLIKNSPYSKFLTKNYSFLIKNNSFSKFLIKNSSHSTKLPKRSFWSIKIPRSHLFRFPLYRSSHRHEKEVKAGRHSKKGSLSHLFARASAELPFQFPAKPKPHACGRGLRNAQFAVAFGFLPSSAAQTTIVHRRHLNYHKHSLTAVISVRP